jgi:heavy metal sensor kinase
VLVLVVCAFSGAVYLLVRLQLRRDLDERLARDLATVERTYREAPYDLAEAESRAGVELFEVVERGEVLYRTPGWARLGPGTERIAATPAASWAARGDAFRVAVRSRPGLRLAVAVEERELRGALATLALVLALGIPVAALNAVAAGSFLAGRVLAPVGAMADRARRIGAESLDERLPVDHPADEFGRLAEVFNGTLSRLQGSFERLRRFTADASHELRTPLTAMRSVGEVALQRPLDGAAYREVIGSMLEEVERLTHLVDGLLVLARADSGRLPAAREAVDLGPLAAAVAEQLRVLAEERAQELLVDAPATLAACDPALVRQVLVNLVDNAIKYTPRGGQVRVSTRRLRSGEIAIEVTDDGPGIAPGERERVFERFFRIDAGRARDAGGTGLGLAIARAVAGATGGRLELDSEVGRGSTFRLVLPAADAA